MFQKILMGLFNNLMKQKVTETIEILLYRGQTRQEDRTIGLARCTSLNTETAICHIFFIKHMSLFSNK